MKYKRKISGQEKIWTVLDQDNPFIIQVVFSLQSKLNAERFKEAIKIASEKTPGAKVVKSGKWFFAHWKEKKEVDFNSIEVEWNTNYPLPTLPDIWNSKHRTCDIWHVKGSNEHLIFRAMHATMDGIGVILWAQQTLKAYLDQLLQKLTDTTIDVEIAKKFNLRFDTRQKEIAKKFNLRFGVRKQEQNASSCFKKIENPEASGSTWQRIESNINHKDLTGIIGEALYRINQGISKELECRITLPFDLRLREPKIKSTANLINSFVLNLSQAKTKDKIHNFIFQRIYKKDDSIFPNMNRYICIFPTKLLKYLIKRNIDSCLMSNRFYLTATLSNIGDIDLKTISNKEFGIKEAFVVGPGSRICPLFITISGNGNKSQVTVTSPNVFGKKPLEEFCTKLKKEIGLYENTIHS